MHSHPCQQALVPLIVLCGGEQFLIDKLIHFDGPLKGLTLFRCDLDELF